MFLHIWDAPYYHRINSKQGIIDTIHVLAKQDTQHPPLYYVMARLWGQWFSNPVIGARSLAAFISLLAFPGIYWLCLELFESPVVGWMAVMLIAVSPFHLPWLLVMYRGLFQIQKTTAQFTYREPLFSIFKSVFGSPRYAFIDMKPYLLLHNTLRILAIILLIYSIYWLCFKTPQQVWLFVLILIGSVALPLLFADLILGGSRSTIYRYLTPWFLGIQLAVAYFITSQISSNHGKSLHLKVGQIITVALILGGVLSCGITSQSVVVWNKGSNSYIPAIAHIINKADRPLLISDDRINTDAYTITGDIRALCERLDSKAKLQLLVEPNLPEIPIGFSDVFLFKPSETLRKGIEEKHNFNAQVIYETSQKEPTRLWRLSN